MKITKKDMIIYPGIAWLIAVVSYFFITAFLPLLKATMYILTAYVIIYGIYYILTEGKK